MDVLQYSRRSGFLYIDTPLTRSACKKLNWANYFAANDDDGGQRWNMIRRGEGGINDYQTPFFIYENWFVDHKDIGGDPPQQEYFVNSNRNTYLVRNLELSITVDFNPEPRNKLIDLYDCRFDLVIIPMPTIVGRYPTENAFVLGVKTRIGSYSKFSIKNFNLASRRRNRIKNTFSLDFSHKDVFILYPYDTIALFCNADSAGGYPLDVNVQARVSFDYVMV